MALVRIKRTKLIIAMAAFCIIFWVFLYWKVTDVYSHHRQRLSPRYRVSDSLPHDIVKMIVPGTGTGADGKTHNENGYDPEYLKQLAKIETAEDQRKYSEGYHNYAFNEMISGKLSYTRPLPDRRNQKCVDKSYPPNLPHVSIIICFYNEAKSVLLRTIHTVLERSPSHLIHEMILIDDASDMKHLKKELEDYVSQHLPKVKLFHSAERLGLIRARMLGASKATGQVLLFLDSHCELTNGWLEPLLSVIHKDPQTLAVPMMDIINHDTFMYETSSLVKGGFSWGMHYQWEPLPADQVTKIQNSPDPYETPTMAGGLFAIDRNYFHDIGEYDKGMDVWGGENLELSFRTWQCGGRIVIVPCSRVGHIFRKRRPYGSPVPNSFTKNTLRVVNVWMDSFKKYYFHINPKAKDIDYGDISERLALRKKLNCRSFEYYLKNVYPEILHKFPDLNKSLYGDKEEENKVLVPEKVSIRAKGILKHKGSGLCVESEKSIYDKRALLRLATCNMAASEQTWYETERKDLRLGNVLCMDVNVKEGIYARLMKCNGQSTQSWMWTKQDSYNTLFNPDTQYCLVSTGVQPGALLKLMTCSSSPLMDFELIR